MSTGIIQEDATYDRSFFAGGGEMGKLMQQHDWSTTPVGPVEGWPQSLKTILSLMIASKFPMFLFWGPDLVCFYNDAYRPSLGETGKHPAALGERGDVIWPEIWHIIGPQIQQVMVQGVATWNENHLVPIFRNGYLDEVYWTYTYSPVRDESGKVGGVLVVDTETTKQVLADRRLHLLRDLAVATIETKTLSDAYSRSMRVLGNNPADIPYSLLYTLREDGEYLDLQEFIGLEGFEEVCLKSVSALENESTLWPLGRVINSRETTIITDTEERFGKLPGGPWREHSHTAALMPIMRSGEQEPLGVLIVGISPRKALDSDYFHFLELVTAQISTVMSIATTFEQEQRKLGLEQQRLDELFAQAPAAIAVVRGAEQIYELANPLYQKLFSRSADELLGRSVRSVFPEIDGQGVWEILDSVFNTGEAFIGNEFPVSFERNSSGNLVEGYYNFVAQPIKDRQGDVDSVLLHAYEVTEQVLARRRVEESESRFRALLNANVIGIITTNLGGEILEANNAFLSMLGYTREEFERDKLRWDNLTPLEYSPLTQALKDELQEQGFFEPVEKEYIKKDGGRVPVIIGGAMVNRQLEMLTVFVLDITERKKLEQRKDDFIALASHELKTPVTGLKIYTQVLSRRFAKIGDEESAKQLARMDDQLDKLNQLVQRLLDVARVGAGRAEFNVEEFSLEALLREVRDDLQKLSENHQLILHEIKPAVVHADKERIRQVLVNLITNATKYSPDSDRVIITNDTDADGVKVCVQDFGIGIAESAQSRVFDRFFRVEATGANRSDTYPGLGLGLYISSEIIKLHGGTIGVNSTPGEGSTFYFTLPVQTS